MADAKRKTRIGRVNTLAGIFAEMARVYRAAARGEMETEKGTRLVYMLREMRESLKATEVEERLRVLEASVK